jgi:hypothetical protein
MLTRLSVCLVVPVIAGVSGMGMGSCRDAIVDNLAAPVVEDESPSPIRMVGN